MQRSRTTNMDGVCFYQISEVSSLSDSDIRDVNLASVKVEAHPQLVEVVIHHGPVEATSTIVRSDHRCFGLCAAIRHIVNVRTGATSRLHFQCTTPSVHSASVAAPFFVQGPVSCQELEHQSACFPARL